MRTGTRRISPKAGKYVPAEKSGSIAGAVGAFLAQQPDSVDVRPNSQNIAARNSMVMEVRLFGLVFPLTMCPSVSNSSTCCGCCLAVGGSARPCRNIIHNNGM